MKRFATVLTVCVLLGLASAAFGQPYNFVWDGARNSDWKAGGPAGNNWDQAAHPGKNQAGDTATIRVDTSNPVTLSGVLNHPVAWVVIDAATNDDTVEFEMTGGTITISDTATDMQLIGGDGDPEDPNHTATFQYTDGALSLYRFDMVGGNTEDRVAMLDIDADLDLKAILVDEEVVEGTHIDASAFCDIVVANNTTFWVDDFAIADGADVEVRGETSTAATFKYNTLTITGTGTYSIVGPVTVAEYDPEPE